MCMYCMHHVKICTHTVRTYVHVCITYKNMPTHTHVGYAVDIFVLPFNFYDVSYYEYRLHCTYYVKYICMWEFLFILYMNSLL